MSGKSKNIAASVRARLTNIAKESNRNFDSLLLQYFQERFLYRLGLSHYRNNFILKGALLFLVYKMPFMRPTKDIDFLVQFLPNDLSIIKDIVEEIAKIDANDGIKFIPEHISIERIIEDAEYEGIRIKIEATMGNIKKLLQLDIAFSDVLIGGPVEMVYPVLLEDQPAPHLPVYSRESAVAEKFEAIVKLNVVTSRMKDFYDILFLAQHEKFHLKTLREAIHETFKHRMTPLKDRNTIFSNEFQSSKEKQIQWTAFLKRSRLDSYQTFSEVVEKLKLFLELVCRERLLENEQGVSWNPAIWKWE